MKQTHCLQRLQTNGLPFVLTVLNSKHWNDIKYLKLTLIFNSGWSLWPWSCTSVENEFHYSNWSTIWNASESTRGLNVRILWTPKSLKVRYSLFFQTLEDNKIFYSEASSDYISLLTSAARTPPACFCSASFLSSTAFVSSLFVPDWLTDSHTRFSSVSSC